MTANKCMPIVNKTFAYKANELRIIYASVRQNSINNVQGCDARKAS